MIPLLPCSQNPLVRQLCLHVQANISRQEVRLPIENAILIKYAAAIHRMEWHGSRVGYFRSGYGTPDTTTIVRIQTMSGAIASIQTGQLSTDLYANAFTVLLAGIAPDPVTAAVWMRFLTSLEVEC